MRDQLEEAHRHRDDGYGRAQHLNRVELPKRFFKTVDVARLDTGFTVTLDGRQVHTPGKKIPLVVPALALARTLAGEWAGQGEHIDPATMPMVRLINSALESGESAVPAFRAEIGKFMASDLLLYRADSPQELVAEQERQWDVALLALARKFTLSFQPTIGIVYQAQPAATLERLDRALEGEGLLPMTALVSIAGLTGSGLLALGLRHDLFTPEQAWRAAHVDEDHQARIWGEDEEAGARRVWRRVEFDAAIAVLAACTR